MKGVTALVATMALALAPGCTLVKKVTPGLSAEPQTKLKSVELRTAKNVNQTTAVAVDVVFVFEQQLADALKSITARAWFRDKATYLARYPQQLAVKEFELVPDDADRLAVREGKKPALKRARAVILYANYLSENPAFTLDITHFKNPVIDLEETEVSVTEG